MKLSMCVCGLQRLTIFERSSICLPSVLRGFGTLNAPAEQAFTEALRGEGSLDCMPGAVAARVARVTLVRR